jgi:hypothetical protein
MIEFQHLHEDKKCYDHLKNIQNFHFVFSVCIMVIIKTQRNNVVLFQGDSGGPLQVVNRVGRYEIIGMRVPNYHLKVTNSYYKQVNFKICRYS